MGLLQRAELFYAVKNVLDGRCFYGKPRVEPAFATLLLCEGLSTCVIIASCLDNNSPLTRA